MKGAFWASWQGAEEHSGCIQSKSSPLLSPASKQRFDKKQILVTAHYQKVLEAIYKEPMLLLPHLSTLTSLFFLFFIEHRDFSSWDFFVFPYKYKEKSFYFVTQIVRIQILLHLSSWFIDYVSKYASTFSRRAEGLPG